MSEKRWQVDVRGGVVGIYYAEALLPGCASNWPNPCLRLDGHLVAEYEFRTWAVPTETVMFAASVALALDRAGVIPPAAPLAAEGKEKERG